MPDGIRGTLHGPAAVLVLSAEDGIADTIRPRLEVSGADLARVVIWIPPLIATARSACQVCQRMSKRWRNSSIAMGLRW